MFGFRQTWCCDFEYGNKSDGSFGPALRCIVAKELDGKAPPIRLWYPELYRLSAPPFDIGPDVLFCAYAVTAELQCFTELGWPMPRNVLDLWIEYRAITNGKRRRKDKTGLINALTYYQIDHIGAVEKEDMRQLAMRGPPYTEAEKAALIDYCQSDVDALIALLRSPMANDLAQFHRREMLFRGRFMAAQTRSDRTGIPLDVPLLHAITEHREEIHLAVAQSYEAKYCWGVYEGAALRLDRVVEYLRREGIRLPATKKTDRPSLKDSVLRDYEERYPQLAPFRECLHTLNTLSRFGLPADADGRSRFFANNFGAVTGRNTPPGSEFIFLLPGWARFLIKPPEGWGVAYLDYSAQEVVVAAALSGDKQMLEDYYKDIYLQQAIKQGRAPPGATKQTAGPARDQFKQLVLGMNYGQTEFGLALRLKIDRDDARTMRQRYLDTYPVFARWRQGVMNGVLRPGRRYFTPLGWPYWAEGLWTGADGERRPRAAAQRAMSNHPCQSTGADMMRVAMIAATEAGIEVCCSLHDGYLIAAPLARLDHDVQRMVTIMKAAGQALLGVPVLVGKPEVVRWPDRFVPENRKGSHDTWDLILRELLRLGDIRATVSGGLYPPQPLAAMAENKAPGLPPGLPPYPL